MLGFVKGLFKGLVPPAMYFGGYGVMLASLLKNAKWGVFLLVFLIPQPNIWYKFHGYYLGKDFMDLLFLSVAGGIILQRKGIPKTENSIVIAVFLVISYFSLWNSSLQFNLPLPISLSNTLVYEYKNYAQMILLYFLTVGVVEEEDRKKLLFLACFVLLIVALRNYRSFSPGTDFSWDRRASGPFGAVGLGANHMGAFFSCYPALFFGLLLHEREIKTKLFLAVSLILGLHPLFFSYSRGAYAAALAALVFYGVSVKRSLIAVAACIVIFWQVVLPESVVDRIGMTVTENGQVEHSAGGRPELWALAFNIFQRHPAFGVGYGGYSLSVGGGTTSSGEQLNEDQDVHSIFMRILCEQGAIGMFVFLLVLFRSFRSGFRLFKKGENGFDRGLGSGFMGCVIALSVSNLFGDRWSYYVLGSYFWIFWGLVDKRLEELKRKTKMIGQKIGYIRNSQK